MCTLPYLPDGREILYVPEGHPFMQAAKKAAETLSLDAGHQTGVVVVLNNQVVGRGANGSGFHKFPGCIRKKIGAPTGQLYWLCPGCSPAHHAEPSALRDATRNGATVDGADLYLWGHWWCCKGCWGRMVKAGVRNVYLVEGAAEKFK